MAKRTKNPEPSVRITRWKVASFGIFTSAVFLLVVATFPAFFFFNPSEQTDSLRLLILLFSTLAWITIAVGPGMVFVLVALGKQRAINLLPYVALFWPVMLVINHLQLALSTGNLYLDYLINFPIFIVTDIITPLLLIVLWFEFRYEEHYIHKRLARNERTAETYN